MSNFFDKLDGLIKGLDEKGILDKQVVCPKCKNPKVSIIEEGDEYAYGKHLTPGGAICKLSGKPVLEDGVIDVEGREVDE